MTTDHELLSVIIADMRKLVEANDKLYLFELEDFADRLQSLLGGGWQDISTAPKDGSDILILSNGCCVCGYWNSREGAFVTFQYGIYSPTHWMPLPLKPTGEL